MRSISLYNWIIEFINLTEKEKMVGKDDMIADNLNQIFTYDIPNVKTSSNAL